MYQQTHHFYAPIQKIDKAQQMVWGYASTEAVDFDGEVITLDAMKGALPGYAEYGNIREMHTMSAVGVTKEAAIDQKGLYIGAKIVDPLAWTKVIEGVYKGFSIGGNVTSRDPRNYKTITGLELVEISLVDRPANPEARIDVFKATQQQKESTVSKADLARRIIGAAVDQLAATSEEELVATADALAKRFKLDTASIEAELAKKDKPKGEYGDVAYADPGYQDDKQPRYPIDTEEHIRAAWSYINKEGNAGKYSSEQVAHIKSKIIAAWKEKIDKEGPPSASADKAATADADTSVAKTAAADAPAAVAVAPDKKEEPVKDPVDKAADATAAPVTKEEPVKPILAAVGKPDATGNVQKGLSTCASAIYLLSDLDRIRRNLVAESAIEGDDSAMPARFAGLLNTFSDAVASLISEELTELVNGQSFDAGYGGMPCADYVCYAQRAINIAKATHSAKDVADHINKTIADQNGPGLTNLKAVVEAFSKAAETDEVLSLPVTKGVAKGDMLKKVQNMHDRCVEMGATCKTEKAVGANDTDGSNPDKPKDNEDATDGGKDEGKEGDKTDKAATADTSKAAVSDAPKQDDLMEIIKGLRTDLDATKSELDTLKKSKETPVVAPDKRNPELPANVATATVAVAKSADTINPDTSVDTTKSTDPKEVLKGILSRPNYVNARLP